MITNATLLACGACGQAKVRLYKTLNNSILVAECTGCLSQTVIMVRQPELELEWGERADGILCELSEPMIIK